MDGGLKIDQYGVEAPAGVKGENERRGVDWGVRRGGFRWVGVP